MDEYIISVLTTLVCFPLRVLPSDRLQTWFVSRGLDSTTKHQIPGYTPKWLWAPTTSACTTRGTRHSHRGEEGSRTRITYRGERLQRQPYGFSAYEEYIFSSKPKHVWCQTAATATHCVSASNLVSSRNSPEALGWLRTGLERSYHRLSVQWSGTRSSPVKMK